MGLLGSLITGTPIGANYSPDDWFGFPGGDHYGSGTGQGQQAGGGFTSTGIRVNPTLAFQVSCIFQGVRLIAETMGSLPLILYRQLDDKGDRERARDLDLWDLLREMPNAWQTSQEFREVLTTWAILYPGGYAEIIRDGAGMVTDLVPLDPRTVLVEQLESGRLRYQVRSFGNAGTPGMPGVPTGGHRTLVQDQVFRVRGFGAHTYLGADLLYLAREAIGLWLATEKFEADFFKNGARPSLLGEHPSKLTPEAYARLKQDINEGQAGLGNFHRVLIAQDGMKWSNAGWNARDAQMTQAREAMVWEIARWLNIPAHMLASAKTPTHSSIEQFAREFIDYTIRPWCTRWEGTIKRDLLVDDARGDVYAEFLLDSLLRGNTKDRYEAYALGIMNGFMSENEARVRENLPPVDGLWTPQRSVNQGKGDTSLLGPGKNAPGPPPAPSSPDPAKDAPTEGDDYRATAQVSARRARLAWHVAAESVVRREIDRVQAQAQKSAADATGWRAWVAEFYSEHGPFAAEKLQLEPAIARAYADRHRDALLAKGVAVLETWTTDAVAELLRLAAEEDHDAR